MVKKYLIVGADNCIGYALCKRLMLERELCVYGVNTRFNHYGNKSFKYALNRNVFDEVELLDNDCWAYLHKNDYDVIFWCDAVLTEHKYTNIRGKVDEFIKIMAGIRYQKIVFFINKFANIDKDRQSLPVENCILMKIPNVYGLYQDKEDIIPRIILNDRIEEYSSSETCEDFVSAWSIADAIINNHYIDLRKYTFSVRLKDLVIFFDKMKMNKTPDIEVCKKLLHINNDTKVKETIYYMLEAMEFYMSNKMCYMAKRLNEEVAGKE